MKIQQTERKGYKKPWLAVVLSLIPLLGLGGCTTNFYAEHIFGSYDNTPKITFQIGAILLYFIFIWGLGYFYLGKWKRGLLSLLIPCLSSFASIFFGVDFEHGLSRSSVTGFFLWVLLVGSMCVVTAVDAFRLAVAHNANIDTSSHASERRPPKNIIPTKP